MGSTLVAGLIAGGIYGLLGLGIVMVYKGSRVLNFAQAEIGTICLYAAWWVTTVHHLPYWLGALAAIALATVIGLVFERLVVRPMGSGSRLSVAVATVGLFTLLFAIENLVFGASPRLLDPPIAGFGIRVFDFFISPTQLLSFAAIIVISLGLAAFLRFTDFGLGVQAAAQDATATRLVGIRLSRVSAFTWGVAAAISAIAALLIEPSISVIAPGLIGEPLFIGGMAAALVGGLTSLPGAFVGGITVGVLEAFAADVFHRSPFKGAGQVAIFAIILAVLLLRPQGLLGKKVSA
ncbi:MAG: branched-chain amino acid ABC transporter permease [Candidatus Dormiibacterota bacterium]